MNRQHVIRTFCVCSLAVSLLASAVQAQDPEVFLESYPNANITVDGDASDWNLEQFGTFVSGGVAPGGEIEEWDRLIGTGDIARLGWDESEENVYYGSRWTPSVMPEDRADNAVTFYARHTDTHQYFLVDIYDDEINTDDPEEAAWANDAVEFYFDPGNDRGETAGGDPAWESDVQLVIDAENRVQVWNSPIDYEEQVEEGVDSAITMTENGWLLEVEIQKDVFDPPLPATLGFANDPDGNNYGIGLSYRDNDDPDELGTRNGDPNFSTNYVWADPTEGGGFPSKIPDNWGQMILGQGPVGCDINGDGTCDAADIDQMSQNVIDGANTIEDRTALIESPMPDGFNTYIGDSDLNGEFNEQDIVAAFIGGKYLTGGAAGWAEGDWDGNLIFDEQDIVAAFIAGGYLLGPRAATAAVPEPASAVLLLIGAVALLRRRR